MPSALDSFRSRCVSRGLSQSLPVSSRARSCARRKASRSLTLDDFAGHTTGLMALVGASALDARAARRRRARRSARRDLRPRPRLDRAAAASPARRAGDDATRSLDLAAAFRVPVMASNGVRFATPGAAAALRRASRVFATRRRSSGRGGGSSANAERYLKPPEHDGAAVLGSAAGARGHRGAGRAARVHARRISATGFPTIRCRRARRRSSFLRRITQAGGARSATRPLAPTTAAGLKSRANST